MRTHQLMPEIQPLRSRTSTDLIVEELRRRIIDGTFASGHALHETYLANQFQVSRGPVREALQRLVQEGLLVSKYNRGVEVVRFTPADIHDVYRVRRILETEAALVVQRANDGESVGDLHAALDAMEDAIQSEGWSAVVLSDLFFHQTLVSATKSPRMERVFRTLIAETSICLHALKPQYPDPTSLLREHARLIELLQGSDEQMLIAAVTKHLTVNLNAQPADTHE